MLKGIERLRRAVKRVIIFNRLKADDTVEKTERRSMLKSVLGDSGTRMIIGRDFDKVQSESECSSDDKNKNSTTFFEK
jgi:hypothetical protein